tara:strand:+ start:19951 stop:20295 length:345 start_codon:yes stop_codon:yes gene_type:complete
MKKINLIIVTAFISFSFSSCSTATIEEVVITETITFDDDVSVIISNNCLSCHSGTFASAGLNLDGYSNVRNATENGNVLTRINSVSNPMPQGGQMPPALIATIEQWAIDGYIEN